MFFVALHKVKNDRAWTYVFLALAIITIGIVINNLIIQFASLLILQPLTTQRAVQKRNALLPT